MRILEEITNKYCRITIFGMNGKYILKMEKGPFEQTYKIPETEAADIAEVKEKFLTEAFLEQCSHRFDAMKTDFYALF